jgi:hypothetical protein
VRARRVGAIAAIFLLWAVGEASAQNRTPGSVDPPTATVPSATAPSSTEVTPVEDAKPTKKNVRQHRRHRTYARPFFLIPPPRYWFKPLPRSYRYRGHRYHRWHRGCRPWYLFGRHC